MFVCVYPRGECVYIHVMDICMYIHVCLSGRLCKLRVLPPARLPLTPIPFTPTTTGPPPQKKRRSRQTVEQLVKEDGRKGPEDTCYLRFTSYNHVRTHVHRAQSTEHRHGYRYAWIDLCVGRQITSTERTLTHSNPNQPLVSWIPLTSPVNHPGLAFSSKSRWARPPTRTARGWGRCSPRGGRWRATRRGRRWSSPRGAFHFVYLSFFFSVCVWGGGGALGVDSPLPLSRVVVSTN